MEAATFYIILGLVNAVIIGAVGMLFKDLGRKVNELELKATKIVPEPDVRTLVDDKLAVLQVQTAEIKDAIKEIKIKLDKIINAKLYQTTS